jgi:hypothetical protein
MTLRTVLHTPAYFHDFLERVTFQNVSCFKLGARGSVALCYKTKGRLFESR